MGHIPIEKLLPKADGSVYKLSRLAAKRAAELAAGRKPLVAIDSKTKTATIALEEIAAGLVVLKEMEKEFKPVPQEEVVAAEPVPVEEV